MGLVLTASLLAAEARAARVALLEDLATGGDGESLLTLDVRGQVFGRLRVRQLGEQDWNPGYGLRRARLGVTLRYGKIFRLSLEPELARNPGDAADLFLEVRPVESFDVRVGQDKMPFGLFEWLGRWRLPTVRRGLVNDVVADRLGFTDRRVGMRARVRLRDLEPFEPRFEAGIYKSGSGDALDGAFRITIDPLLKGADLSFAGSARAEGATGGKYGFAGAVAFDYDRKGRFFAAEVLGGRARRLSRLGGDTGEDASFLALRTLAAYAFRAGDDYVFEPFLAFELLDPNMATTGDLGGDLRGGVNVRYKGLFRVSLEADRQVGQEAFVEPDATILTLFLGMVLG